jgi:catalase-peroxidase
MTVLVGGLRVLGTNVGGAKHGVFTSKPETLSNDFFVNLLDMGTEWKPVSDERGSVRRARPQDRQGQVDRHARRSRLRLELAAPGAGEVYASADAKEKFVEDFVAAWNKVMNLDRFDLAVRREALEP